MSSIHRRYHRVAFGTTLMHDPPRRTLRGCCRLPSQLPNTAWSHKTRHRAIHHVLHESHADCSVTSHFVIRHRSKLPQNPRGLATTGGRTDLTVGSDSTAKCRCSLKVLVCTHPLAPPPHPVRYRLLDQSDLWPTGTGWASLLGF